jgi:iron complex outermembrane receptor protein
MGYVLNVPKVMRGLTFFVLVLLGIFGNAQKKPCTDSIQGEILDINSNEPIAFATILIEGTQLGAISDEKGQFIIQDICEGEVHLVISHIGYKSIVHHHDAYHGQPKIYMAVKQIALEGIVVETTKDQTQLKTTSISSKQLSQIESLGKTGGDLLQEMSGVSTLRTGQNSVKPMVHGLHSNRVLIINNGVRHSYQSWGRDHAPEIDPSAMDHLRLVKGAATVRYGAEALGGVILFDPKRPKIDQELTTNLGSGFASNGRAWSNNFEIAKGTHRFAWIAGISGTLQGDLSSADYLLSNTGKKEIGYHVNTLLHQPNYDIEFYVSRFDQTLGILRGSVVGSLEDLTNAIGSEPPAQTSSFNYSIGNPHQETIHDLYKVKGSFFLADHELNIQYALQRNQRKEFDVRRGTNNDLPSIDLVLNTHTVDIDWKLPRSSNWDRLIGFQWAYQDNNNIFGTNTIPFVPNYNQSNAGAFAVFSHVKTKTTYEFGARYDFQYLNARGRDRLNDIYRNELTYHNVTFTSGLVHKLNNNWSINTNVGTAWRAPTVGELYSFGKHQFNFEYGLWRYQLDDVGNITTGEVLDQTQKEVLSERGLKWIAGVSYKKGKVEFELVPYVNIIQNFFFTRPYGITNTPRGPFPYFIYDQTNALFYGVDADVQLTHSQVWGSEIKMAYVHATDLENNASFLEIPPLNLTYEVTSTLDKWKISLKAEWNARQWSAPPVINTQDFLAPQTTIDRQQTFDFLAPPSGYLLLHVKAQYQHLKWQAQIEINNLLNQSYRNYTDRLRYFADDLGTNIRIGVNYRLSK